MQHLNAVERRMMPGSFASSIMGKRLPGSMPPPVSSTVSSSARIARNLSLREPAQKGAAVPAGIPSTREKQQQQQHSKHVNVEERKARVVKFEGVDSFGSRSNIGLHRPFHGSSLSPKPVRKEDMNAIRKASTPPKVDGDELPSVGALIKTTEPFRQTLVGCVVEVRDAYRPLLVKWQDGKMDAVQWEENEQLSLVRRGLKSGDKIWVEREALEKFGWVDQRALKVGEERASRYRGEVVKQIIVIDGKIVEEGGVVDFLSEARDHDGKEGCSCKMASGAGSWVEQKEEIDPNCPINERREVRLLVQARVDVGQGEAHLADLEPWGLTLISTLARSIVQAAARRAVQEKGISAATHAQVQAKAMLRHSSMLEMAREGDVGLLEAELAAGGCDINFVSSNGATLLGEACRAANNSNAAACCRLLAQCGADLNLAEGARSMRSRDEGSRARDGAQVGGSSSLLSRLHMRGRPLHVACASGNYEAVRVLIEEGADLHATDEALDSRSAALIGRVPDAVVLHGGLGHTPLISACCGGEARCVEAVLRASSVRVDDLNRVDQDWHRGKGRSYEKNSSTRGAKGIRTREKLTASGWSPGSTDATSDSWEWVLDGRGERRGGAWLRAWGQRNAIDRGVLDAKDALGRGALHWACCAGSDEIAQMLLLAGASAVARDAGGNRPVDLAAMGGDLACLRTVLEAAVMQNKSQLHEVLSERKCETGETALHKAAMSGVAAVVEYVCSKGGDVSQVDGKGLTPLLSAIVEHDSADVVAALLVHGCDANARDAAGKSCLHYAVSYSRREVLKLLLKPFFEWSGGRVATGADGDVDVDKDAVRNRGVRGGDNPIAWAAEEGPKLIGGGRLSLDWQDDDGTTALVEAVKMRDDESASLLLRAGALVHPKDKDGMSVIEHAVKNKASGTLQKALRGRGSGAATVANGLGRSEWEMRGGKGWEEECRAEEGEEQWRVARDGGVRRGSRHRQPGHSMNTPWARDDSTNLASGDQHHQHHYHRPSVPWGEDESTRGNSLNLYRDTGYGGGQGWRGDSIDSNRGWFGDVTVPAAGMRRRGNAPREGETPWASHRTESVDDAGAGIEMLAKHPQQQQQQQQQQQKQGAPWASDVTGHSSQHADRHRSGLGAGEGSGGAWEDGRGQDWHVLARGYAKSLAMESQRENTQGGGGTRDWESHHAHGYGQPRGYPRQHSGRGASASGGGVGVVEGMGGVPWGEHPRTDTLNLGRRDGW